MKTVSAAFMGLFFVLVGGGGYVYLSKPKIEFPIWSNNQQVVPVCPDLVSIQV